MPLLEVLMQAHETPRHCIPEVRVNRNYHRLVIAVKLRSRGDGIIGVVKTRAARFIVTAVEEAIRYELSSSEMREAMAAIRAECEKRYTTHRTQTGMRRKRGCLLGAVPTTHN